MVVGVVGVDVDADARVVGSCTSHSEHNQQSFQQHCDKSQPLSVRRFLSVLPFVRSIQVPPQCLERATGENAGSELNVPPAVEANDGEQVVIWYGHDSKGDNTDDVNDFVNLSTTLQFSNIKKQTSFSPVLFLKMKFTISTFRRTRKPSTRTMLSTGNPTYRSSCCLSVPSMFCKAQAERVIQNEHIHSEW